MPEGQHEGSGVKPAVAPEDGKPCSAPRWCLQEDVGCSEAARREVGALQRRGGVAGATNCCGGVHGVALAGQSISCHHGLLNPRLLSCCFPPGLLCSQVSFAAFFFFFRKKGFQAISRAPHDSLYKQLCFSEPCFPF